MIGLMVGHLTLFFLLVQRNSYYNIDNNFVMSCFRKSKISMSTKLINKIYIKWLIKMFTLLFWGQMFTLFDVKIMMG